MDWVALMKALIEIKEEELDEYANREDCILFVMTESEVIAYSSSYRPLKEDEVYIFKGKQVAIERK